MTAHIWLLASNQRLRASRLTCNTYLMRRFRSQLASHGRSLLWSATTIIAASLVSYLVASSVAGESSWLRQSVGSARGTVHHLFGVLRPDPLGRWYIQLDDTHQPYGLDSYVEQTDEHLRIFMAGRFYSRVGSIQITSDDGFGAVIRGHGNVGLESATIIVKANGQSIDPAEVWSHLPTDRLREDNGNFWINLTMIE